MSINAKYARFATLSRLLSSMVTEKLVPGYFVPMPMATNKKDSIIGVCIALRPNQNHKYITANNILLVAPLRGCPVTQPPCNDIPYARIDILDPLDLYAATMYNPVLQPSSTKSPTSAFVKSLAIPNMDDVSFVESDPIDIWNTFANDYKVEDSLRQELQLELESSIKQQEYDYNHIAPLPSLAHSSSIDWEQAIMEGHPTHPMNKARKSFPPMRAIDASDADNELIKHPKICLVAMPRDAVEIRGPFEALTAPLVKAIAPPSIGEDHVLIPFHELQWANVKEKFKYAQLLPGSLTMESLTSLRTVVNPEVLPGLSLKLCLGIKVTSALRTISHATAYFGPGFSEHVVPRLTYDRNILTIERELASAIHHHPDPDVAKHSSCVVREAVEYAANADPSEAIVECAALVEKAERPDTDETLLIRTWGLDTEEKRTAFLKNYIDMAIRAFIPPCLYNGVAFEAHLQNVLARFDRATGQLKGFIVRDLGGLKVYEPTLMASCGQPLDVLSEGSLEAKSPHELYSLIYHTLIKNHLGRLIRTLGLHYNGVGWAMVRASLDDILPRKHLMRKVLLESKTSTEKCLLTMKLQKLYRDYIYQDVPNMILFDPSVYTK